MNNWIVANLFRTLLLFAFFMRLVGSRRKVIHQRVSLLKVGGQAAEVLIRRLDAWSQIRSTNEPTSEASNQRKDEIDIQVDELAERLRSHAYELPILHFMEWSDKWSGGYDFRRFMTLPAHRTPRLVEGKRYELFWHVLPDGGRLKQMLEQLGEQQFPEQAWCVAQLLAAIDSWHLLVKSRSILIFLRYVIDGSVTDEEVVASFSKVPSWIA